MKKNPAWAIPGAALGSSLIVAVTILHFIRANRAGMPGGYLALFAGTIGVGLLTAICHHLSVTSQQRGLARFLVVAIGVAGVTAVILFAVLIRAYGS